MQMEKGLRKKKNYCKAKPLERALEDLDPRFSGFGKRLHALFDGPVYGTYKIAGVARLKGS